jgi:predicted ATPase
MGRDHARRLWQALPLTVEALLTHGPHVVPTLLPGPALLSRARAATPAGAPWLQRLQERVERGAAHSGTTEQSHLFQQVTNLLRALAEVHPLLLILDDLQWADTASVGLLFHLGRRLAGSRILVAGAYRPEEVALGRAGERHPLETVLAEFKRAFGDAWLDLTDVPAAEGRHFVDALLEAESNRLGEGFRRALFKHTGGHPLFTVELLRTMQARGNLVQDEAGCWVEGPALHWDTLPARVEGVIEARIGRLEGELRDLLSVACVEGEEFTAQVVARVQEVGQRQALRWLSQELEARHRLVREQSASRVGRQRLMHYRSAHALFQQYLYNHLGEGERALLHGEVAAVLAELFEDHPEGVAAIAPQLARHFTESGDEGHALRYLILAGDGALTAYANREAEAAYRRALDLAPGKSERAHLLSGLGEALFRQSRFQEAIQTWHEGIEQYRALQDSNGVALLYASSARAAGEANDPAEALRLCLEGLAEVQKAPDGPGLARLTHETAQAYASNALREKARTHAQRALEMAERLGDVEVQAHALATPGLLGLPSVEDRWQALDRAVDLAESHGLLDAASRAHSNLASLAQRQRGDYRAAREHLRRAAELYGQAGNTAGQVGALIRQAFSSGIAGGVEEGERLLAQARTLLRDLAEPTHAAQALLGVEGVFLLCHGRWAEAARRQRALQAAARERGDDLELAHASGMLAWAVLEANLVGGDTRVGTLDEAEANMLESIAIWDRSFNIHGSISVRVWLAWLRLEEGRPGESRRLLAEARQMAGEGLALPEDDGFLYWMEGQVACAERRWAEALAAHEAAHKVCARYALPWHWARFRLDWAEAHFARGEPGDRERALDLLRETQAAFEEVGTPGYAAVARERLEELSAAEGAATRQTLGP